MFFFECFICKQKFSSNYTNLLCQCGEPLDIHFNNLFAIDQIDKKYNGLWRFRKMLPLDEKLEPVSYSECFTPLEKIVINNKILHLKHDYLLPSGSYKDRGSSVMLSHVKSKGITEIIEDSSGNAGASIAAYAAKAGIKCRILLPESTTEIKIKQIAAYGAEIERIQGDRDKTTIEALKLAQKTYYASHIFNPFFYQGIKTLAYEIFEQMNWNCPENIVIPAGNGTLVVGIFLGFRELKKSGLIAEIPKITAIQAVNCSPLKYYTENSSFIGFEKTDTIAEGIAIGKPPRLKQIVEIIKQTNGQIITVDETEIVEAWKKVMTRGILIEPTSSVVFAALFAGLLNNLEGKITMILTGSGLKSVSKIGN